MEVFAQKLSWLVFSEIYYSTVSSGWGKNCRMLYRPTDFGRDHDTFADLRCERALGMSTKMASKYLNETYFEKKIIEILSYITLVTSQGGILYVYISCQYEFLPTNTVQESDRTIILLVVTRMKMSAFLWYCL